MRRDWWEDFYRSGRISGKDSRGAKARAKADVVNRLVRDHGIDSIVEWGCGDGVQQSLIDVDHYLGVDVSAAAVAKCCAMRPDRQWLCWDPTSPTQPAVTADLALSMSVIYHLQEDETYARYMAALFGSASRMVAVFCTDVDRPAERHVRHHRWTDDVPEGWDWLDRPQEDGALGWYVLRKEGLTC